jgi:predicted house-cleaning noncanonical NTP pyrophosphatase (MazG superfamily)
MLMGEEKNNFEKWYDEFHKAWNVRMIENEHLMPICFLEMLSCINKVRYVYGGQYKTVNLSSFKIQQSGTGKGVADKIVADCLRHMGYNVCKLNSFTEAAIIGSVSVDMMGKVHIIKGALGEYDFIWIDEARNLIVGNQWTNGLLEIVNGYLDDGMIFKRLAKGEIKYWSSCNFGTGTFFFDKLKPTVLTTGLFQRSLFSYKSYTQEDVMRISKKFNELAEKNYMTDLEPVMEKLKEMRDAIDFEKYNVSKVKEHPNYIIKMMVEASRKFGNELDTYFEKEIFDKVKDKRLQDILTSFLIRSKELGHRIMCLYAVWNAKDIIDEECADYAYKIVKEQLDYVLDFVSDIFEGTKFDAEDLNKEELKKKKVRQTEMMIEKTIIENQGITKLELRTIIKDNRSQFSIGELQIFKEVLPRMIFDKKIEVKEERSESGEAGRPKERMYIKIEQKEPKKTKK